MTVSLLFFVWFSPFVSFFFSFFYSSVTPRPVCWWLCSVIILLFLFFSFFICLWRFGPFSGHGLPLASVKFFFFGTSWGYHPHTSNAPTWRAICVFLTASSFLNPSLLNFFALKALVLHVECKLCLCSLFKRVLANSCVVKINYAVCMGGDEARAVLGTSPVINSSHFHVACPQWLRVLRAWCHVTWPLQILNSKLDPN